jgi:hypothetical protein
MPITAKLSRKVYERLGDEVVNAIVDWFNQVDATYRADLREMNDLNFARFEAKLGERIAELEARIDARINALEARVDARINALEARVDARINALETKFERRFAQLEVTLTRRIFVASAATFLAQIVALITLFKFFGSP